MRAEASGLRHIRDRSELQNFDLSHAVSWIFNVTRHGMWWANREGLNFWKADGLEDLLARDYSDDSATVRRRLRQCIDHTPSDGWITDTWTLFPRGEPITAQLNMTPILVGPDRDEALFIEASIVSLKDTAIDDLRLLEATRSTLLMISCFSLEGRLISRNPAAIDVYGSARNEPLASEGPVSRFAALFEEGECATRLVDQCLKGDGPSSECRMRTKTGLRWHKVALQLGRDPMTGERTLILIEEDVHHLKEALIRVESDRAGLEREVAERTRDLNEALFVAESANAEKSKFLARMSHELRTPLNSILGYSEALLLGVAGPLADPMKQRWVRSINESGGHLLSLIDDILDLSKIEAKEESLSLQKVDITEIMEELRERLSVLADGKTQRLRFEAAAGPILVLGDRRRLTQIFTNVIGNSIKFTPEGGDVSVSVQPGPIGYVRTEVSDTGVGIRDSDIDRVTRPFQTSGDVLTTPNEGTGLGLALSHSLIRLHEGEMTISSRQGHGTVVAIDLPLAPEDCGVD